MSDYIVGHIRTFVPVVVAWVVALAADAGFNLDLGPEAISTFTAGITLVYYSVVRALAERWPTFGILLGVNKAPEYGQS